MCPQAHQPHPCVCGKGVAQALHHPELQYCRDVELVLQAQTQHMGVGWLQGGCI